MRHRAVTLLPLVCLLACHKGQDSDSGDPLTYGDGLFSEGCPSPAKSLARQIGVDETLPGHVAVGTNGDFLLANEHAAYVITEPNKGSTYYYYGGIVADAVAMDGCAPASEDGLDEVGLVLGSLDLLEFRHSVLRGFRGDSVEILSDGSDGSPATIRVHGTDDRYWLVDYELTRGAAEEGDVRPLSEPFGLAIALDYSLDADSSALKATWHLENTGDDHLELLTAALISLAPTYASHTAGGASIDVGGLALDAGIPLFTATDGHGAFAYGLEHGALAYTNIAGIDIAVNLTQAVSTPLTMDPGESADASVWMAVGPTDGPTALEPLVQANPELLPGIVATPTEATGIVTDPHGAPIAGAEVDLWADGGDGPSVMDVAYTGADGRFRVVVPQMEGWSFQLSAKADGRDDGPLQPIGDLQLGPVGALDLQVTYLAEPIPVRISLRRDDGAHVTRWTDGSSVEAVPPGDWTYTISHGFEYEPVRGEVTIPEDGQGSVSTPMARIVDTTGWVSLDTHVHDAESPDSRMDPLEQTLHGASHGLEVIIHSEHEHLVDQRDNAITIGVSKWVRDINGEEMTATVPEHMTTFPITPDGTPRGGPIRWYQKDIATLFAEMHAQNGGGINILNHPGYMDLVGWDVVTAEPTLDDPTRIGLLPDAELWSWDLDGIEVMNGFRSPLTRGNHRFELWQSLLNAGHRVTAVGCSDDHGGDEVGYPRTYFAASTDDPWEITDEQVVDALKGGRAIVSMGAFARVSIADAGPGDLVEASGTVDLDVRVVGVRSIDVRTVAVFVNCDQVARLEVDDPAAPIKLDTIVPIEITGDSTVVIAAFGADPLPDGLPQFDAAGVPRVLTNPIYVDADGNGQFDAPGGRVCSYDADL